MSSLSLEVDISSPWSAAVSDTSELIVAAKSLQVEHAHLVLCKKLRRKGGKWE